MRPPPFLSRLLALLSPSREAPDLLSEMEEEFRERAASAGVRSARRWYRGQALRSLAPLLARRVELLRAADGRAASGQSSLVGELARDLTFAGRSVRRRPLFAVVAVAALGVGIGAPTTMFGLMNAVLFRPLPVHEPGEIYGLRVGTAEGRFLSSVSYPDYVDLASAETGLQSLAAHHLSDITLASPAGAEAALGMDVSGNYWETLGIVPALGRFFGEPEASPGDPRAVAVISYALWQARFGADPEAIGRSLSVNGQPFTIVGVAPQGFHGTMLGARPAVWLPVGVYPGLRADFEIESRVRHSWLQLFGRLAPGARPDAVAAALGGVVTRYAAEHDYPEELRGERVELAPFSPVPEALRAPAARVLALLLAGGCLVLLIATVNVSGMLLARASTRGREMAVRRALGAGRARLVRQLLTEGVFLALLGGSLGLGIAWASNLWLSGIQPPFARGFALDLGLDGRVLAFALAAALGTPVLFALVPALQATRPMNTEALRGTGGGSGAPRLRSVLVGGQVALSVVLLVATALLVRTLQAAVAIDHGFEPAEVLAFEVGAELAGYDEATAPQFYARLLERVRPLPEIEAAAISSTLPLSPGWDQTRARIPGHEPPDPSGFAVGFNLVSPGFFETLRMPVLQGRSIRDSDLIAERSLVVNQAFADRFWPDGSAVGRVIRFSGEEAEVVGVVPTGKYRSPSEDERIFAYVPVREPFPSMWLEVRHRGDPAAAAAAVRRELAGLDSSVPITTAGPLEDLMGGALFPQRAAAILIGTFGGAGLALAAVGIFGLLAFIVAQRTREIGVRIALGAERGHIVRSVVLKGLRPVAVGVVVGLAGALGVGRLLTSLLYGVGAADPLSYAAAATLLVSVSAVAAWLPARRATRVDAGRVLREE